MDSFELNKIAGAVLSALLVLVGTSTLVEIATTPHGGEGEHEIVGFQLPAPGEHGEAGAAPAKAEAGGFEAAKVVAMVPQANAEKGQAIFKKCMACHSGEQGGPNKVGPVLWGVVGRPKASVASFGGYSSAMKEKGGEWDLDSLATFLHKPKDYVSGTKMNFAGINKDDQLADLLAYLSTLK
jgi:cytochrome c